MEVNISRTARAALCGSCVPWGAAPMTTALYSLLIITDGTAAGSRATPDVWSFRAHPSPLQLYRFVVAARSARHRHGFSCPPEAAAGYFWIGFREEATTQDLTPRLGCVRQLRDRFSQLFPRYGLRRSSPTLRPRRVAIHDNRFRLPAHAQWYGRNSGLCAAHSLFRLPTPPRLLVSQTRR